MRLTKRFFHYNVQCQYVSLYYIVYYVWLNYGIFISCVIKCKCFLSYYTKTSTLDVNFTAYCLVVFFFFLPHFTFIGSQHVYGKMTNTHILHLRYDYNIYYFHLTFIFPFNVSTSAAHTSGIILEMACFDIRNTYWRLE